MKIDSQKHNRRSMRLEGYDYTLPGMDFITLVTHKRECLFGEVQDGVCHLHPQVSTKRHTMTRETEGIVDALQ
jgi:hypothetical protein